jgi:hypothetical protein
MKTIFIVMDHGLALAYFLQTELTNKLLEKDVRIVFLVQDAVLPMIKNNIAHPNVVVESMRDKQAARYMGRYHAGAQELFDYVRRTSASRRIPLTYVDTHRQRKEYEAMGRRKQVLLALRPVVMAMRRSRVVRETFRRTLQVLFTPHIYDDLFDQYKPDLIISNTAGWRLDQYLLREANRRGIKTATVIIGWDNPSSQGMPGAFVDYAVVWSEVHKWEMTAGVDWPARKVFVGGMPLYDGYVSGKWVMPREEYFRMHGLDPEKKLVAFAATALSISPNLHIVQALIDVISSQSLDVPAQLLIRLHPNHFKPFPHYREECAQIIELANHYPDVHVVEPKEVPGGLERYSGEDFPEKASMLAHCDVLATVYSTMVVEAALHGKPFISVCIDTPKGWDGKFWIPLHEVPGWPTAARVNKAHAGRTVFTVEELRQALNVYLTDPQCEAEERRKFVKDELTYLNGEATQRTADYLLSLLEE